MNRFLVWLNSRHRNFILAMDLLAVIGLVSILVFTYVTVVKDPDRYLEVVEIFVSDAVENSDPDVMYNRIPKKSFVAQWTVQLISSMKPYENVCHGSGVNFYEPGPRALTVKLSWFLGHKNCKLGPGTYLLDTAWVINQDTSMILRNTSNEFTIWASDDLPDSPTNELQPLYPRR